MVGWNRAVEGGSYGEQAERDGAHKFERGYCSGGHGFESELSVLTLSSSVIERIEACFEQQG
jgi:hypothetical protein